MKFYFRTIFGSLIALGAAAFFLCGIYHVARGGTCASGGPYVSTRQCAPDSTAWMFALPPALLVGLGGLWLFRLRGPRPGAAQPAPATAGAGGPRGYDAAVLVASRDELFTRLAAATSSASPIDPIVRLERLQALHDSGALSTDEFQQAKVKILAEM